MRLHRLSVLPLAMLLVSHQLVDGYALVHDYRSPQDRVNMFVRPAKSAEDALAKHKSFVKKLGIPDKVVNVLDAVKGISMPIGQALSTATEGASLAVAKGVGIGVDVLKQANQMFGKQLGDIIGRIDRGKDEAYHPNVVRGNRGRDAEWAVDKDMWAIVTLPGSVVPLNKPVLIPQRTVKTFTIVEEKDPENPGQVIWTAQFSNDRSQYLPAEEDKRDKKKMRELAKTSGWNAYNGKTGVTQ